MVMSRNNVLEVHPLAPGTPLQSPPDLSTIEVSALRVFRQHPGATPEAREVRAAQLQQLHPEATLKRCAAVLASVEQRHVADLQQLRGLVRSYGELHDAAAVGLPLPPAGSKHDE